MAERYKRIFTLGYALVILILAANVVLTYLNIQELVSDWRAVQRSELMLSELGKTLSVVLNAETGQRGYLLTGYETYLQPYERATGQIPAVLDLLGHLAAGNAKFSAAAKDIRENVSAKLEELEQTVAL